jgi:hypothetical protein
MFTCYYLIICVGLTITLHFCGGSLESLSTFKTELICSEQPSKTSCCSERKEISSDCCNDSVLDLSDIDEDSLFHEFKFIDQFVILPSNLNYFIFNQKKILNKVFLSNYIFDSNAPPLYKLFGNFIYYA